MPKYIFRIDDVHEKMDYEIFEKLTDIFLKNDTPVILCIIPENKEPILNSSNYQIDKYFTRIKLLKKNGSRLIMHGVFHQIEKNYKNYFGINNYGEFGYNSYEKQYRLLQKGKEIFIEKYGIGPNIFCAPAHSYNIETFKALKSLGFRIISDGISLFPYKEFELLFYPQLFWFPLKFLPGIQTIAIHPQSLNSKKLKRIEKFVSENKKDIILLSLSVKTHKKCFVVNILYCLFLKFRQFNVALNHIYIYAKNYTKR